MNNLTQDLTKYVNLMEDSGFKAVYGDVQNKPLLIHLLNLVLPEDVVVKDIVEYRDRERSASTIYGKSVRLDLLCEGEDGSLFDVEVQRDRQDYFFERCLYYASELYYTQLEKGNDYDRLRPVYLISLLDFKLDHQDDSLWDAGNIISRYRMTEERTGELGSKQIIIIFAEISRFTKELAECSSESDYLFYWFKKGWQYDEEPKELEGDRNMKSLVKACDVAAFPKDKLIEYQMQVMNERDTRNIIKTAERVGREEGREEGIEIGLQKGREEGVEIGMQKGREEEKLESARRMLRENFPVELVAKCSNLTVQEVKDLLQAAS